MASTIYQTYIYNKPMQATKTLKPEFDQLHIFEQQEYMGNKLSFKNLFCQCKTAVQYVELNLSLE